MDNYNTLWEELRKNCSVFLCAQYILDSSGLTALLEKTEHALSILYNWSYWICEYRITCDTHQIQLRAEYRVQLVEFI